MSVTGDNFDADFTGTILGGPAATVNDPNKLYADVEVSPPPSPSGIGLVIRVVAPSTDWPQQLLGSTDARVHVVGKNWATNGGLMRCTPTSIAAV